jgi:hypothetical protein
VTHRNQPYKSPSQLDPDSQRFQDEIDAIVRRWADGNDIEYRRRWRQLGNWSLNRTQGDPIKKERLKKQLFEEKQGRCEVCGDAFERGALTMHRVDTRFNLDKTNNFGYFAANVQLICNICHQEEERSRRSEV